MARVTPTPTYYDDSLLASQRLPVLAAIVALHIGVAWMIASGLMRNFDVAPPAPPIVTKVIDEARPVPPLAPPSSPDFEERRVIVPEPEFDIEPQAESDTSTAIIAAIAPQTEATESSVPVAARVAARRVKTPDPKIFYSPIAIRLGLEGTAVVRACIGPDGRLVERPTVQRSTGHRELDSAAIRLATAVRYAPGTIDGRPTTDCLAYGVRFQLED